MEKNDCVILDIPRKAYAIKNDIISEVAFQATTEDMTEWYFKDVEPKDDFFTGHFVFAKDIGKILFLGERAKERAEEYLKKKLKRKARQ